MCKTLQRCNKHESKLSKWILPSNLNCELNIFNEMYPWKPYLSSDGFPCLGIDAFQRRGHTIGSIHRWFHRLICFDKLFGRTAWVSILRTVLNAGFMPNALTYWAIRARHLLSHVFEHWFWRYRYFWSKVNIWYVNCARATSFIFAHYDVTVM